MFKLRKKLKLFIIELLKKSLERLGVQTQEREGVFVIIRSPINEDKVLLVRHGYGTKKWSLPGGGIKQSEFANDAAEREAFDETGLRVKITKLVGHFSFRFKYGFMILFESRIEGSIIHISSNETEIIDCRYFHYNDLPIDMYDAQRGMIRWAQYSKKYNINNPLFGHPDKPPQ